MKLTILGMFLVYLSGALGGIWCPQDVNAWARRNAVLLLIASMLLSIVAGHCFGGGK